MSKIAEDFELKKGLTWAACEGHVHVNNMHIGP